MTQPTMTRMRLPKSKPFCFTRWLPAIELHRPWLSHFKHHNVPAGIVSRLKPRTYPTRIEYAVWRHGVEATGDHTFKADPISPDMKVEESVHGFEEKFNIHKEEKIGGKNQRRGTRCCIEEEAHP